MSPARARTSGPAIVQAARAILEADGVEAVTMHAVATAVDVRAPSLYKHVADRAALIRAVGDAVLDDLESALRVPDPPRDAAADLRGIAHRYRSFVHANPAGYALLFTEPAPGAAPDPMRLAALAGPILEAAGRIVGEHDVLPAARTFVAWAHGFTSMERAGAFRLGGDVDAAYEAGLDVILSGISGRGTRARG